MVKKIKVTALPNFSFEAAVSSFIDKSKYEFIPISYSKKKLLEKYAQNVFGDWCYPLKAIVAMYEAAIMEQGVKKIISVNLGVCRYPHALGDIKKWITADFEYFAVPQTSLGQTTQFMLRFMDQIKKAFPDMNNAKMVKRIPFARMRMKLVKEMEKTYFESLPLVKNAQTLKTVFNKYRHSFLNADSQSESKAIVDEFIKIAKKQIIHKKPKFKLLLGGDTSLVLLEFGLFDLDVFLGQNRVQVVCPYYPTSRQLKTSKYGKQAREIYKRAFSNKHSSMELTDKHDVEIYALYHLLDGIDQGVDGVVFIKPTMCTPCDSLSFVLKKENYFEIPFVEFSYDEHSGINGIETRLEAFINIVGENK
ncbi:hypothetical protein H8D36_07560 [archaeon]|nr:hypothetical protein [archaeon]